MVAPGPIPGYVPARGDVVWLQFGPQAGSEQAGHRPALVLSPSSYNGKVGLAEVLGKIQTLVGWSLGR
jgi:mRNA-degrading endonuclease toxin of MazEF toxin-antitoxin module